MDNLSTSMLDTEDVAALAALDPEELDALFWRVNEELTVAKRREKRLHDVLEARYAGRVSEALLADHRDTGTVHLADGVFDVTATRPKRVKWDGEKLRAALDQLPAEDARHYAKVTVSIDERKFAAAPPAVQAVLNPARTVETGKATYSFAKRAQDEEAA